MLTETISLTTDLEQAYFQYAVETITDRALPRVEDGLKPVQRRILYAMHDMGLRPDRPHKKSARIVGEAMGKYHPHGDQSVYMAMVRMAQDFAMRHPLVDGQGNFGSIDGDSPAAMRYTEARLAEISHFMLHDLDQDTVDFVDNFDGSLKEPVILPAALPNLLINGATGIAVGMATNIPPHNVGEVCDAVIYVANRWRKRARITVDELMKIIPGPDFPTGGVIYRYRDDPSGDGKLDTIRTAYETGRSRIVTQARVDMEDIGGGKVNIVVSELPYAVQKSTVLERIAREVRDGKIGGVTDLRDESDHEGIRVVIEVSRMADAREVLESVLSHSQLRETFGVNALALVSERVNGDMIVRPQRLSLRDMLVYFIEHRLNVIVRRSRYELAKREARLHIVQGLLKALDVIDEVIDTIRRSRTTDSARTNLRRRFKLTEVQAQAILDMPLRRLAALERKKIEQEYKEKKKLIRRLQSLLRSPKKILGVVKDELLAIGQRYGDARRTQIVERGRGELTTHDLIPDEEVLVTITRRGNVRQGPPARARTLNAGRGKDVVVHRWQVNSRDSLYLFTADGRVACLPVHQIPNLEARPRGTALSELCPLLEERTLVAVLALPHYSAEPTGYLLTVTRMGKVKRSTLAEFVSAAAKGEAVVAGVDQGDELAWVHASSGGQDVILVTRQGKAIRFSEDEVRPMGLTASGVLGIKLSAGDQLIGADLAQSRASLLVVSSAGYGKWTSLADYPSQKRYGGGVMTYNPSARTGELVGAREVRGRDEVWLISARGKAKRLRVRNVPRMGRATRGKALWTLPDGDQVVALTMSMTSAGLAEAQSPDSAGTQKKTSRKTSRRR